VQESPEPAAQELANAREIIARQAERCAGPRCRRPLMTSFDASGASPVCRRSLSTWLAPILVCRLCSSSRLDSGCSRQHDDLDATRYPVGHEAAARGEVAPRVPERGDIRPRVGCGRIAPRSTWRCTGPVEDCGPL